MLLLHKRHCLDCRLLVREACVELHDHIVPIRCAWHGLGVLYLLELARQPWSQRRAAVPGGIAATVVRMGLYQKLSEAHAAVRRWCAEHGYALAGPNWEIYGDWTDNPAELRTDVFYLLQESEQHALDQSHSLAEPLRKLGWQCGSTCWHGYPWSSSPLLMVRSAKDGTVDT